MPNKTQEYLNLAQQTAKELTRYWENWSDYLTTASRLYKYSFADQLMIYAQRPDATACADFDIWNNRMNRYVRRGSKGIALLDESSGFPRLHYVFDVSDTGVRRNSRDPEVWQYNDDLKQPVSEMLAAIYGISGERVSQQLADVAGKLVADYWDNNGGDIRAIVDGSLLMDYDEAGVEMQFKSAAAMSVTYTLLERCGFEPAGWFDKDDFQAIYNFSTPDSVYALGAAVSDMSREVLWNIAGLTVDPNQNKLVYDFCRKLEDETLADWYDQMFYFVRAEMECYTNMLLLMQDIEEDEDWGPEIFEENEDDELSDDV